MQKIFKSKLFIILTPIITFVLFFISGFLLSFLPNVKGSVYGYISGPIGGSVSGSTNTKYIFMIKNAIGIWLIGLAISFLVLLICVLIRKMYTTNTQNTTNSI